ncbi:serine hydrolase domain-containing protein [Microbacterium azadirachtae]|uniref:D-alanyl-D-alanine carboxypeptidase n=1 Tax=Microbacterium azadirachtae TaxID=582680 RepID=A0A0F0LER7_9MICO|nr:serine hydrolase domain-containing protein [Microbacterium azadirachtae]KJL31643.1 D-alanyl-D-alanine carboxypeptidase precursor [Microbacterium azadirachtae]
MNAQTPASRTAPGRRTALIVAGAAVIALVVAIGWIIWRPAGAAAPAANGSAAPPTVQNERVDAIVRDAMKADSLKAVIVRVTVDGKVVAMQAYGDSMTGVPATTDMHFRNGAVAFEYVSTLLLEYVDEGKIALDDTVDKWMPSLPEANKVTLRMLTNQTTGYPDFETDPGWTAAYNADPFHEFTFEERLKDAFNRPLQFEPGTNWSYAHTNFMILGHILSMIGGAPLDQLLQKKVLGPMGLTQTAGYTTATVPEPVLHAYSSERRVALGIPPTMPFTEESTFWNPAWGTPIGAAETTTITDMATTAVAVGTGKLLSSKSFHEMTDSKLIGFGTPLPACAGSCFTQVNGYNYGLGVVRSGSWQLQNPLLSGYSATEPYLPSKKMAVAVATTFLPGAFDANGIYDNSSDRLFRQIATELAPDDPPPPLPPKKN